MNNYINPQIPEENSDDLELDVFEPEITDNINNINNINKNKDETAEVNNNILNPEDGAKSESGNESPQKNKFQVTDYSLSGIIKAIKDYWTNLPGKTKIFAVSSAVALIAFVIIIAVILNQSPYVNTYIGQDEKESIEIMGYLRNADIKYKWDPLFKIISLREKDQAEAVAALAMQGYPRSGILYEEETGNNMLETQGEKRLREINNKQKRLEATIGTLTGINYAIVTLSVPDNSKAVLTREVLPSEASVVLHLKPGHKLSAETVKGIENIVQKSVENLSSANISITDGTGTELNREAMDNAGKFATIGEIQKDFEIRKQKEIENKIMHVLEPIFGVGGVRVVATVLSDFSDLVTEAKNYFGANIDEETGKQEGIIERMAKDEFISSGLDPDYVMGVPGSDLNSDSPGYYENEPDLTEDRKYVNDFHYTDERLVDYVFTQSQRTAPEIKNIGVAITVNAYELDDELEERLINLAATSSGINYVALKNLPADTYLDADYYRTYVTVIASPFVGGPEVQVDSGENIAGMRLFQMLMLLGAAVILIIILVIILIAVIVRKNRRKEQEEIEAAKELEREFGFLPSIETSGSLGDGVDPAVDALGMAAGQYASDSELDDEDELDEYDDDLFAPIGTKENALKKQIKMFMDQNPEIAAQLIRTLIKGDEVNA